MVKSSNGFQGLPTFPQILQWTIFNQDNINFDNKESNQEYRWRQMKNFRNLTRIDIAMPRKMPLQGMVTNFSLKNGSRSVLSFLYMLKILISNQQYAYKTRTDENA